MLKVWIVGSEGQIGEAINEVLDPLEIEVLNTDKNALDITETDEVLHFGENMSVAHQGARTTKRVYSIHRN